MAVAARPGTGGNTHHRPPQPAEAHGAPGQPHAAQNALPGHLAPAPGHQVLAADGGHRPDGRHDRPPADGKQHLAREATGHTDDDLPRHQQLHDGAGRGAVATGEEQDRGGGPGGSLPQRPDRNGGLRRRRLHPTAHHERLCVGQTIPAGHRPVAHRHAGHGHGTGHPAGHAEFCEERQAGQGHHRHHRRRKPRGGAEAMAKEAEKQGIRVFILGIGTAAGAPIPSATAAT